MNVFRLALCVGLTMAAACAVTPERVNERANAPDPDEVQTVQADTVEPGDPLTLPDQPAPQSGSPGGGHGTLVCSSPTTACLTATQCHHSEGANIGTDGCSAGLVCCEF
jgi:hypothetical protein